MGRASGSSGLTTDQLTTSKELMTSALSMAAKMWVLPSYPPVPQPPVRNTAQVNFWATQTVRQQICVFFPARCVVIWYGSKKKWVPLLWVIIKLIYFVFFSFCYSVVVIIVPFSVHCYWNVNCKLFPLPPGSSWWGDELIFYFSFSHFYLNFY